MPVLLVLAVSLSLAMLSVAAPGAAAEAGVGDRQVAQTDANAGGIPSAWRRAWPDTDFSRHSVSFGTIKSGGPPKDGIPSIDAPAFKPLAAVESLSDDEPVIGLSHDGVWKAYPLRILVWHEIVNDTIAGRPIAVTYCPLCNSAIVFDRRVEGPDGQERTLEFGTTGKLRNSDLVMYDRQTESWWQQFMGEAIVGALTGTRLDIVATRLESVADFRARAPADAQVLVPNDRYAKRYGYNPYRGYDTLARPFLYDGSVPEGIEPLARVVSLEGREAAWSFDLLRAKKRIETPDGTVLTWSPGQASAVDASFIPDGRDVGTVTATKNGEDQVYFVEFAFAFHAFHPDAPIHHVE